ncbi:hypothetical protein ERO13_A06G201501v2 [Gossypium hirsutum]|nr:hypothetical protein ERO13_A06G201501v2 [Gossypium hirsutum]
MNEIHYPDLPVDLRNKTITLVAHLILLLIHTEHSMLGQSSSEIYDLGRKLGNSYFFGAWPDTIAGRWG